MRWRLILEEIGPELKYIKRENNVVADSLSCLEKSPNQEILNISELYGYDDEDLSDSAYPIRYHDIAKELRDVEYLLIVTHFKARNSVGYDVVFTLDVFKFRVKPFEY